ncbi:MAG: hypothetical protein U5Q44_09225 [Dehalococcoidia bacterium]|nr:hypothetical protein [Dehalococcoidia bacterium]
MSACAIAGASFTPSPTMATVNPCSWKLADVDQLVLRRHRGAEVVDAGFACHRACRCFAIAGQHHNSDSEALKRAHRAARVRLHGIGDAQQPGELTIDGDPQDGIATGAKLFRLALSAGCGHAGFIERRRVPTSTDWLCTTACTTATLDWKSDAVASSSPRSSAASTTARARGWLLPDAPPPAPAARSPARRHARRPGQLPDALRQRPGLVQDNDVELADALQARQRCE